MSDNFVTRHEKGAWTEDVVEALERVLRQGGNAGRPALEHELLRCDLLYLARDAEGPTAFLFVAHVRLPVGPELREARYLGLSAARDEESGAAVFERFASDARAEEQKRGRRLLLFTTAGTPFAVRTAHDFWADVQPARDASFRAEVLPLADAARAWLGSTVCLEYPFALPRLAGCGADWRRMVDEGHGTTGEYFRQLGVEQARGERLLLLCSVPARDRGVSAQAA
jgi:hypothetical protein